MCKLLFILTMCELYKNRAMSGVCTEGRLFAGSYSKQPKGHKMDTKPREIDDFHPFGKRPNACLNKGFSR